MPHGSEFLLQIKNLVKEKLKELGAFVDEELPDYIMVMVANKKRRESMNSDLQLFLGTHTEHFTEWLHNALESFSNSDEKKKGQKTLKDDARTFRRIPRSSCLPSRASRSRSRSPIPSRKPDRSTNKHKGLIEQSESDFISVRTEENEFSNEAPTSLISTTSEAVPTISKDQRRIVSTASLNSKSTNLSEKIESGLRSVVKLSTHTPSAAVSHGRSGSILLKRAMVEAQASVSTSVSQAEQSSAAMSTRKRPAEPVSDSNLPKEPMPPPTKSTRFVVTLNEGLSPNKHLKPVSDLKSRLGPRVTLSTDDATIFDSEVLIDARDILLAKRKQNLHQISLPKVVTELKYPKTATSERAVPIVINLNDTDEDDGANCDNLRLASSPPKQSTYLKPIEPPKRENIPSSLEKCRYWPSCRNGSNCQFTHPKEECPNFPNCRYRDRCLYFHPPCKFGATCSRPNCLFSHAGQAAVGIKQTTGSGVVCRFYPNCKNISCPFLHPMARGMPLTLAKMCKFGSLCANRTTCPFSHPSGATANSAFPVVSKLKWIAPGKSTQAKEEESEAGSTMVAAATSTMTRITV